MKISNYLKLSIIAYLIFAVSYNAQDMRQSLFGEIDKLVDNAQNSELKYLSPTNYEKAIKNYEEASEDFEKGSNLKDIKETLAEVKRLLSAAEEKAKVSTITLKNSIAAREDAIEVKAEENASELWQNAERKFREAGEEVEDGDIPDAEEASKEAEELFRKAELNSIKVLYLDETWKLIESAKKEEAEDLTPITLKKSNDLVTQADKELAQNRYDTDLPRNLAQQAKYEANHAIFLSKLIKDFEASDKSMEDLLLSYEEPLKKISAHFDYDAKFDQPITDVANNIVQKIVELKTNYQEEKQTNYDLRKEIEILKEELGGLTKEKSALDAKMARLAEVKAKYDKISGSFSKEEAEIFKEGNNIYIRLISLNFPVGKSIIEAENFGLLSKVQNAIKEFPNSTVVVEGHTDSYGGDEKNMELSQERASSVKQYLIANMNLQPNKIMSFGYGETKPIANNETKEGRAKNRRIDLIIQNAE